MFAGKQKSKTWMKLYDFPTSEGFGEDTFAYIQILTKFPTGLHVILQIEINKSKLP